MWVSVPQLNVHLRPTIEAAHQIKLARDAGNAAFDLFIWKKIITSSLQRIKFLLRLWDPQYWPRSCWRSFSREFAGRIQAAVWCTVDGRWNGLSAIRFSDQQSCVSFKPNDPSVRARLECCWTSVGLAARSGLRNPRRAPRTPSVKSLFSPRRSTTWSRRSAAVALCANCRTAISPLRSSIRYFWKKTDYCVFF